MLCCHTGSELQSGSSVAPDNDVLIQLAKTYSYTHSQMHKGDHCYDSKDFKEGITNGYYWYPLPGQSVNLSVYRSGVIVKGVGLIVASSPPSPGFKVQTTGLIRYSTNTRGHVYSRVVKMNICVILKTFDHDCPSVHDLSLGQLVRVVINPGDIGLRFSRVDKTSDH